ncbi:MAG: beta/gamma crystallin-related protein [Terricaulis sp.]
MRKTFVALLSAFTITWGLIAAASAQEERFWRPPGGAQADGEISLYRQQDYQGPSLRAQTAVNDIGRDFITRSVRVSRGRWELCTGANFTGQCSIVSQSQSNLIISSPLVRTRSLRPADNNPPSSGGAAGPSLRGMAAAFFTQPSYHGQRIPACARGSASAACARSTATEFCRVNGYNFVGNVALQTERGRTYLADILCKRSAN